MQRKWNIPKDLEADAIPEIASLFRRFEIDHDFSHDEVFNELVKKEFLEKVYLIHERFKPLIREFKPEVKLLNEFHKKHTISFQATEMPKILKMVIQAECMELAFLIRILKFILKKFDNKKLAEIRRDKGITNADFKKAKRIKKKRLSIKAFLKKIINQKERNFKIVTRVWHKNENFYLSLRTENFTIILHHGNIKSLINKARETIPLFLAIIEGAMTRKAKAI